MLNEEPSEDAVNLALRNQKILDMEKQHAHGYASQPSRKEEFAEWESEQSWGES